jgi:glycosyltransferase involved in cell wall biosynthesis
VKAAIWAVFYFLEAMILVDLLRRRRITHVHNHFANASANVSLLATRFLKLPWSLTLHGNSETDYPAGLLLGEKLRAASFVNCVCYYGRAQAYRTIPPEHWGKLDIVRCGLDLSLFPRRPCSTRTEHLRIISVARLTREKGHSGLLQAFRRVREVVSCELILVGDGPEREALTKEIRALRLEEHVHLHGSLPESSTLVEIGGSDVLVLASLIEGLPVVLLEAMALGVPVIAPNVAGIPELIEDGRDGLLFPPTDWNALYGCLLSLLLDPALRRHLSEHGRDTVERQFDIRQVAAGLAKRFQMTADDAAGSAIPWGLISMTPDLPVPGPKSPKMPSQRYGGRVVPLRPDKSR